MILYKYLSPDRIDVLENFKIRFSQPGALNDPFEVKPSFQQLATDREIINSFQEGVPEALIEEYKKLPRSTRRKISIEKFIEAAKEEMPKFFDQYRKTLDEFTPVVRDNITEKLDKEIGILSLTQTPKNKLMWSHYADSHKGFIIGFDATHYFFNQKRSDSDEFGFLRKVEYHDGSSLLKPMTEYDGNDVFLVKGIEWKYEEEWRILRPLYQADDIIDAKPYPVCLFKFTPDIVREIIIGYKMADDKREELVKLIDSMYSGVKMFNTNLKVQDHSIEIHQII